MTSTRLGFPIENGQGSADVPNKSAVVPAFNRHESFHPRHGWLKKGFDAAVKSQDIFLRDEAHIELGVGKNMARAIRYWCHAFKVLDEKPLPGTRGLASSPTSFGQQLLGQEGWDPYLEDIASLWLLHWRLLQPSCIATTWYYAFFHFTSREFEADELTSAVERYADLAFPSAKHAHSSLRRDVACLLKMYAEEPITAAVTEESIASPFCELGLIQRSARGFQFGIGPKPSLPASLFVSCCLEYAAGTSTARTIPVSRLLSADGSPGMAFKLTESSLIQAIEEASADDDRVRLADTAGLVQMSFDGEPLTLATELRSRHFRTSEVRP